jgi:hypothetical protein
MNKKKLYNMKALFYLLPLVSLLVLAACAGQTPASIPRHECTPDCPADIQPDTVPGQAPKSSRNCGRRWIARRILLLWITGLKVSMIWTILRILYRCLWRP